MRLFAGILFLNLLIAAGARAQAFKNVPGTVVAHLPASGGQYIGSPSLAVLPNGDYIASHDLFGPNSSEFVQAVTRIFRSSDKGRTWKQVSEVTGAFWSSLFVHRGALYLLGPDRHHGTVLIRRSEDGGSTWTQPTGAGNGLLLQGMFHCAPMPVVEYNGRLWRPMETAHGPVLQWGKRYGAMVLSAPVDADLLKATSWQASSVMYYDSTYLGGNFGGWLEGNFVVDKQHRMWDMLRVDNKKSFDEKAAMVAIAPDGKTLSFDPAEGFIPFDGGSKKFVIRYDSVSRAYWTFSNSIPEKYRAAYPDRNPASFRNVLMLRRSEDLVHWKDVKVILEHDDVLKHGFQYVDWRVEGNDILLLSRTAYFDGTADAHNNHDANFLTFHRISGFRKLK
ncbi:sialidase family protein [Niabella beijingensis]|uniref:sialidase family protein n=1 Tax=Niabella beijingensis TaxID=2872700 RepID=UPI001CC0C057|nr:sialidase family protein [Niabella beijingensis]MBZ4191942.1 glycoside hydrolase [Niabella beijingensis]